MMFKKRTKSESILHKRIRKFKAMKRGYYSFIILTTLYLLSFLNPILINNKALIVKFDGEYFFPIAKFHPTTKFNQEGYGEAQYRKLDKQFEDENSGNWVLMPPYPFHPNESLLSEIAIPLVVSFTKELVFKFPVPIPSAIETTGNGTL